MSNLNLPTAEDFAKIKASNKKIPIVEIFGPTIQGEGSVIGQQTYFMRFGLCDYLCKMCDSLHSVLPNEVRKNAAFITQKEIFERFIMYWEEAGGHKTTKWITFTGGNPCIHNLQELVDILQFHGFKIHVETQGTKCPEWLTGVDLITVSPKGPGMGETCDLNVLKEFMECQTRQPMNIKVVVFDERDLEFARMLLEMGDYQDRFFLSLGNTYPPGSENMITDDELRNQLLQEYRIIFDEIKTDPLLSQVKFLPQWHVFVWGNDQGH